MLRNVGKKVKTCSLLEIFLHNIISHNAFQQGLKLLKSGKEEEAFNAFNALLNEAPFNSYLRHQIIMLGEKLNKEVNLPFLGEQEYKEVKGPEVESLERKNNKSFTPK